MGYDIFISYARADNQQGRISEFVDQIKADFLQTAGRPLHPFFDLEEIKVMEDWRNRILTGLRQSRLLVAFLSPSLLKSQYCQWEFEEYVNNEIAKALVGEGVAPVYFVEVPGWSGDEFEANCADWIKDLRRRQSVDLRPWYTDGVQALLDGQVQDRYQILHQKVAEYIKRGEIAENRLGNALAHNPNFVGRQREIRDLFQLVAHERKLTCVHGLGGIGKTALVLEYAHANAHEYGGGCWQVSAAGREDLSGIIVGLHSAIGFEFTEEEKGDIEKQFDRVMAELRSLCEKRAPHRCLLIIDNVDQPRLLDPAITQRLPQGDWLHVIATSRLGRESLFGVQPDRAFLPVDELGVADALQLIESYQ